MDKHCLLSRIFTTDCFSIVEVFTNGLLVIDLCNNRNTYNNSSCGMIEFLFLQQKEALWPDRGGIPSFGGRNWEKQIFSVRIASVLTEFRMEDISSTSP
jgi:hypothetical protein